MLKTFVSVLSFALLFLGCANKEYYKPDDTVDSIALTDRFDASIIEISADSATLDDGTVITKTGKHDIVFPEGYRFVFKSDEWNLALKTGGEVFAVKSNHESKTLKLPKTVASAALKNNLLAVVFADNELALYDFDNGKLLFKEPATEATAVDMRIANPRFLNDLVLFPTLDGKIVIVNAQAKEQVRSIIVSSQEYFNNIIYFNVINDTLFAATPYKIYSLGAKESRVELEIRDIVFTNEGGWASTKQGEIVSLSLDLEILQRQKFPFAHFLGLIVSEDSVYAAEKEGYMVVLEKDLSSSKVYDISLEDGYFYTADDSFYFDNVHIKVK